MMQRLTTIFVQIKAVNNSKIPKAKLRQTAYSVYKRYRITKMTVV